MLGDKPIPKTGSPPSLRRTPGGLPCSRSKSLKLRYLVHLYAKELVMHNFVGLPADQLLERMVELSLRTEEHL